MLPDLYGAELNQDAADETRTRWRDEVVWAMGIILTRAFGPAFAGDAEYSLVPVADLLNHDGRAHTLTRVHENNVRALLQPATNVSVLIYT